MATFVKGADKVSLRDCVDFLPMSNILAWGSGWWYVTLVLTPTRWNEKLHELLRFKYIARKPATPAASVTKYVNDPSWEKIQFQHELLGVFKLDFRKNVQPPSKKKKKLKLWHFCRMALTIEKFQKSLGKANNFLTKLITTFCLKSINCIPKIFESLQCYIAGAI